MDISEKLSVFKNIIEVIDPYSYKKIEKGDIDMRILQYAVCYDHEVAKYLADLQDKSDE